MGRQVLFDFRRLSRGLQHSNPKMLHKHKTILVIDDEASQRKFISRVLEDAGYSVLEGANYHEALLIHGQYRGKIDVLVTDISLPGDNGYRLARALLDIDPGLSAIFISGLAGAGNVPVLRDGDNRRPFPGKAVQGRRPSPASPARVGIRGTVPDASSDVTAPVRAAASPGETPASGLHFVIRNLHGASNVPSICACKCCVRTYNCIEARGKMPAQILIVDDDSQQRSDLAQMVESLGFQVSTATDGEDALAKLASFPANVILTDLIMPRMDGIALLKVLAERGDRTPTIVLTGFGSVDQAISFVHDLKAFWFLEKPVQSEIMRTLLERALQQNQLIEETQRLNRQLSYQGVLDELTGDSPSMKEVFSLIQQVAPTTASVFISGESGTGKELVARAIHRLSPRNGGPFVAVNCAALPDSLVESELFGHEKGAFTGAFERHAGCFEQAHNGTLFLDEIGEMPIGTQAKLLRVIEESKVRRLGGKSDMPFAVRVLAATNRSPEEAIRNNHLREDLYYRLNVFQISLPPLRDRKEDIPSISAALIRDLNKKHDCRVTHLHPDVLQRFRAGSWPGNVRELRNVIERAVIMAFEGAIHLRHLPDSLAAAPRNAIRQTASDDVLQMPVGARMAEVEEAYLRLTLKHTKDNKTRAAELLGLSLRTLHNKVLSYAKAGNGKTRSAAGASAQ